MRYDAFPGGELVAAGLEDLQRTRSATRQFRACHRIVNSRTGIWGSDRDLAQGLGRVPLTAATKSDNEETLTIYLVPDSADPSTGYAALSGKLRIRWGTPELSGPWSVKQ